MADFKEVRDDTGKLVKMKADISNFKSFTVNEYNKVSYCNICGVSKCFKKGGCFYSTDRSKAVVPVLVLLFVALWFILRGDLLYVFPCVILFLCFLVLLLLRLPRLGKRERANFSAFRTFVRFVLVWICRFPLPLGVWDGLRFVIGALPGLFSYLFLTFRNRRL